MQICSMLFQCNKYHSLISFRALARKEATTPLSRRRVPSHVSIDSTPPSTTTTPCTSELDLYVLIISFTPPERTVKWIAELRFCPLVYFWMKNESFSNANECHVGWLVHTRPVNPLKSISFSRRM